MCFAKFFGTLQKGAIGCMTDTTCSQGQEGLCPSIFRRIAATHGSTILPDGPASEVER